VAVLFLGAVILVVVASLVAFAGLAAWAADRVTWNRWHAIGAAALAALGYDGLLVPPIYSLVCETAEGWAAVALFFATAAVAGELWRSLGTRHSVPIIAKDAGASRAHLALERRRRLQPVLCDTED